MFGTLVCSKYTRQQQEQQFVSTWILEHQHDCRHFVFTIEINVKLDGMKRKLGVPMVVCISGCGCLFVWVCDVCLDEKVYACDVMWCDVCHSSRAVCAQNCTWCEQIVVGPVRWSKIAHRLTGPMAKTGKGETSQPLAPNWVRSTGGDWLIQFP